MDATASELVSQTKDKSVKIFITREWRPTFATFPPTMLSWAGMKVLAFSMELRVVNSSSKTPSNTDRRARSPFCRPRCTWLLWRHFDRRARSILMAGDGQRSLCRSSRLEVTKEASKNWSGLTGWRRINERRVDKISTTTGCVCDVATRSIDMLPRCVETTFDYKTC